MLLSGNECLGSLRDGCVVYIGRERGDNVTAHPAFRNAARTLGIARSKFTENVDAADAALTKRYC